MGSEQRSARNWFSGVPLDRSEAWRARVGRGEIDIDLTLSFSFYISARGEVLIDASGALAQAANTGLDVEHRLSLGTSEGRIVFALIINEEAREGLATDSHRWIDLRLAALSLPHADAGFAAYARALVHWHQGHRYCGRCGASTRIELGGHRRRCSNANCDQIAFPRLDPAIIVLVEHQGRVLLGRQASWPAKRYSVLAGFVEPGESLEDALRREVQEEAGVNVVECDYHSSQPWPFPASLMLGFTARAEHDALQYGDELEHAAWFAPDALLAAVRSGELRLPPALSLSARLLEDWYEARTGRSGGELFERA